MELFVAPGSRRGVTRQLYEQLREAIVTGRVADGDRLPASRELADQLGVSRHTVTTVYGRLAAEGYLVGRAGGGSYVSYACPDRTASAGPAGIRALPVGESLVAEPPPDGGVDLRMGRPDPRLFPLAEWRRCVVTALQVRPDGHVPRRGDAELRRALARWIARSRGVECDPEDIVVTAGAQHAVDVVARALVRPGDVVAIEDPGYVPVRRVFESLGAQIVAVPVDADGIVVDAIPPSARLVYVTPSHQSPTGVPMGLSRRRALLEVAARNGMAVIEDDYDSEFRHGDRPLEPLFRLDVTGQVVYVGTFSKTLTPTIRLGFAVLPPGLAPAVAAMVAHTGSQPAHAIQAGLHRFVADGHLDRHLRRARRAYSERHRLVTGWLRRWRDDDLVVATPASHSGLHVTAVLPSGVAADGVIARARRVGLAISPLGETWAGAPRAELLAVGFGAADLAELERALPLLTQALAP